GRLNRRKFLCLRFLWRRSRFFHELRRDFRRWWRFRQRDVFWWGRRFFSGLQCCFHNGSWYVGRSFNRDFPFLSKSNRTAVNPQWGTNGAQEIPRFCGPIKPWSLSFFDHDKITSPRPAPFLALRS